MKNTILCLSKRFSEDVVQTLIRNRLKKQYSDHVSSFESRRGEVKRTCDPDKKARLDSVIKEGRSNEKRIRSGLETYFVKLVLGKFPSIIIRQCAVGLVSDDSISVNWTKLLRGVQKWVTRVRRKPQMTMKASVGMSVLVV